ncbi:hypothetical protein [Nonlabens xiamenensis]|uniref:hypothetical protein n=1 Tax=Nonlabens xiamenensis TaxID=2341043 RepID=UPI000F6045DC|nr:hypothetical protein [Nonlabens xiamenensis]
MAVPKRNPVLGGLMAAVFIGFGAYRLYSHFYTEEVLPNWRLVLSAGLIIYGLYLVYTLIPKGND